MRQEIQLFLGTVSATAFSGNASSATKLSSAKNIVIQDSDASHSGAAVGFDGSAAVNLKLPATIKATLDGVANEVKSYGNHTETASGSTANAPSAGMATTTKGMFMTQTYNDAATPVSFGNIINLLGNGSSQLLCEWSGADSASGHLYYRSHRDTSTGGWGAWRVILDNGNFNSYVHQVHSGTSAPAASLGKNGDLYVLLES